VRGLRAAVALLTRIPVGGGGNWDQADLSRSVKWMPLVGSLIGLGVALAFAGLVAVMPALLASGVALGLGVILTGALHEDGLADLADALGGGADRDEILRIMKDPTHGTYGVVALVLSFVLRVTALSSLGAWPALALLPAIGALSRSASTGIMAVLPPASSDGLGAAHAGPNLRPQAAVGALFALIVGTFTLGWWVAPFALLAGIAAAAVGATAWRRIHGFTGDVLGAAQQVAEVLLLLVAASLVATGGFESVWWR
jgi:adenosylcobinamide-GDP ribazoletransferase